MSIPEYLTKFLPFFNKKNKADSAKILGLQESFELNEFILSEFNQAYAIESKNFEWASESWKLFSGFNDGQWLDEEIVSAMRREGRNPFQGNIIRGKVEGLAGSILKNFFDIGFEPVNGDHSDLTRDISELMMIDKELLDWNNSYRQLLIDGLVHLGVEEMYISDRYDPLGNIGFKRILPGHIILDPTWLTNDSWELKRAWKVAYLTAKEIKECYETKSEEIDNYVKMKMGIPTDFNNGDMDNYGFPHYSLSDRYGDKYRVIEYQHIEKEKNKIEFVVSDGTVVPDGPDEYKREWAILNGVDLSDGVATKDEYIDVCYVTSICPTLSKNLVLEDKKSLIQIGRLPFFPWSSGRINGINSGIPDLLKSIQVTYNKRESQFDFILASTASGGVAMDPEIVNNDDNQMRIIEQSWSKPNFKFWSSPGALASGRNFFQQLPKNDVQMGIVNEINRLVDMADRVSRQPAASDARSEGSEESGILFARKQMQAEITQTVLTKSLEQHWNEKGEAYFLLAKKLYSGIYREFYARGSGRKIELNKPTVTPSGEVLQNDISQLPRMKVIISESPEGVTNRTVDRTMNIEILRVLGPESPIQRARAAGAAMKTLNKSREDKTNTEQDSLLEITLARENVMTQIMQLKAAQAQIQQQLMMASQPQLPGIAQASGDQASGGDQSQSPQQRSQANTGIGQGNSAQNITNNNQAMLQQ